MWVVVGVRGAGGSAISILTYSFDSHPARAHMKHRNFEILPRPFNFNVCVIYTYNAHWAFFWRTSLGSWGR